MVFNFYAISCHDMMYKVCLAAYVKSWGRLKLMLVCCFKTDNLSELCCSSGGFLKWGGGAGRRPNLALLKGIADCNTSL